MGEVQVSFGPILQIIIGAGIVGIVGGIWSTTWLIFTTKLEIVDRLAKTNSDIAVLDAIVEKHAAQDEERFKTHITEIMLLRSAMQSYVRSNLLEQKIDT